MKYLYFKSEKGNFGDDLNPWLWPKLFDDKNLVDENAYLLGIGSILHPQNQKLAKITTNKKIIFGTGVRPSNNYQNLIMDETWDIRFLRGPYSSRALGNGHEYISDAAYAIRHLNGFPNIKNVEKKYDISIMPYFHSMDYFDWDEIAKNLGYNLISPFSEKGVEHTLKEIAASQVVISEAMHGAIIADILRVPWRRFVLTTPYTEGERVSEFKWNDWLNSINIVKHDLDYIPFYEKTRLHAPIKKFFNNKVSIEFFKKNKVTGNLIESLSNVKDYYLSQDSIIDVIDDKFHNQILNLRKDIII